MDAGHVSEYALKTHWLSQPGELSQGETFRACASVVGSGKRVYFFILKAILCRRLRYCLQFGSLAYELTHRRRQRMHKLNSQVERVG